MFGLANPIAAAAGQSPPVDTNTPYSTAALRDKTIVITGGAAGFGAAFARAWAAAGAHIIIGDIDDAAGRRVVASLAPGNHHFFHCDVARWDSQAAFFRRAVAAAAPRAIDAVVPNAGIAERQSPLAGAGFECPAADVADAAYTGPGVPDGVPDPRAPQLAVVDVNITGVLYTVHLGLYWMGRARKEKGDRHILLISSIAGLVALPGQALYTASKHAVTGLFRALRGTAGTVHGGLRVNMLCPYFVETGMLAGAGRAMLAGGGKGRVEDVVDAGTRLMADHAIRGRALVVGPRMVVGRGGGGGDRDRDGGAADLVEQDVDFVGVPGDTDGPAAAAGQAVWECYADDLESSEIFVWRFVRLLNAMAVYRGWRGFFGDVWSMMRKEKEKVA